MKIHGLAFIYGWQVKFGVHFPVTGKNLLFCNNRPFFSQQKAF
jgi:hypothetical protein